MSATIAFDDLECEVCCSEEGPARGDEPLWAEYRHKGKNLCRFHAPYDAKLRRDRRISSPQSKDEHASLGDPQ